MKSWICEVFPAKRIKRPEEARVWRMLLEGSKTIHRASIQAVGCIDDHATVELRSVFRNQRVHLHTWECHDNHAWLRIKHFIDRANGYFITQVSAQSLGIFAVWIAHPQRNLMACRTPFSS